MDGITLGRPGQHGHEVALAGRGLVDLTIPASNATPPARGGEPAKRDSPAQIDDHDVGDPHNGEIGFAIRSQTHIDAPSQVLPGGARIDEIPIERFWRPAVRLELTGAGLGQVVDSPTLEAAGFAAHDLRGAILLLATGWFDRAWRSQRLYDESPVLGEDAAAAIAAAHPAALGLDFAADRGHPWPNHRTLLRADVLLIENLIGLTALPADGFEVIALPSRLAGGHVGPARVVASIPQ